MHFRIIYEARTIIIARLEALASPEDAAGMARFGIRGARVLGVSLKTLRAIAREAGREGKQKAKS